MKTDLIFIAGLAGLLILLNLAGLERLYQNYPFVFILGGYFVGRYTGNGKPAAEQ
ncbi:hypothetical protein CYPRO_0638 [Cyclonatronum proteinivorum]|uniref:Uncharacterized protein n=1 Tax=Cyclonatronum proteinivorum TaxID=1457365 RepID=A0A345UHH1_9BACT|nr:hypothetical protein [Cyclonatronum proteinivorum]AXI99922.1 hypothetical protein CYPRO_0638 [Cyclonatronum proteinivorum]